MVGRPISILIPPDLPDELPSILNRVRRGESINHFETVRLRKDGQRIIVSLTISPISDTAGKISGASTIARDITERKMAEEKIAYQAHLLDNVNDAVIATDAHFNLTSWNHAATELYGYKADEVLGHKAQEIIRSEFNDAQRSTAIQSLNESGSYQIEVLQHHRDGHLFWVEGSTFALKEPNGQIHGYISINRDITKRKRAEEALQAKNEEIRAMSQQLWQAAKLATMGELAASIAHELNNPLATISLRTELLMAQFSTDTPQSKSLQIIDSEVKRMSALVANLLQFSRRDSKQISTVNVREEITNTLELIHYHLRKYKILTVEELSPDVPLVQVDRQQLRQVLLNLFTNAADAMPQGGTLTIRASASEKLALNMTARLRVPTAASLGLPVSTLQQILIEVSDTGEGIPPERFERVWEPFYTTKPEGKGTGLGLAICRRIIQEHGGTIEIISEGVPGKGTTIRITLPAVKGR
jgi:PAS domain S-box-containing protein